MEEALGEPVADGDVVDLHACIGYGHGGNEDAHGHPDVGAQRGIGVAGRPVHLHVDHGIVGDVERIGYHAQKAT